MAAFGNQDGSSSSSDYETETSNPCDIPSTFEVSSDFNEAPADRYYEECYKAVTEQFNK